MNTGVTINIPEINWPAVFLILIILFAWRYRSYFFDIRPTAGRKGKPKKKGKPRSKASKTAYTFTPAGTEKVYRQKNDLDI